MFPQEIIRRKRDGHALSREEINHFVNGLVAGSFKDYQSAALLMAIFLNGMSVRETRWLTEAMMRSGEVVNLSHIDKPKVDKHSTGGVGDKVSLILAPMAAAAGLCVPMMSGRGLGHTGGTRDKLESIPGFRVDLSTEEFRRQLAAIDQALIGQTGQLVPADKKLYALRDATATVESIPLICASIMSKKLAEGIDSLVLDVKFGKGAFMKSYEEACLLAESMVAMGKEVNKPTTALLTNMDQPLGHAVGNAIEVIEAIECLKGKGPRDLMEVTYALGVEMLISGNIVNCPAEARARLQEGIASGEALRRFRQVVEAQSGDARILEYYSLLPTAQKVVTILFEGDAEGKVHEVDAYKIGVAAMVLGAGRESLESEIDPAVGISHLVKIGDSVGQNTPLCQIHINERKGTKRSYYEEEASSSYLVEAERLLREAIVVKPGEVPPRDLIRRIIQ